MLRKGVYPYAHIDSSIRFKEKQLPPKECFFNDLTKKHISDDEYDHAWSKFDIRSLGEYHDLYLKYDVLLLADIFEYFRDHCMECYNLGLSHYFSLPGFSWDACLRYTKVELELITNIDQYLLVEKGIRGGISVASNRASTAKTCNIDF